MLIQDLDTPCAVVDLDVMENNLRRCQAYFDRHGLALRPHIKTHKIPAFAHLQIRLGARGHCQKLGEAEVMVEAGITDVLLTYNVVGQVKLDRLVALARRGDIKVTANSAGVAEGLSSAMSRAGLTLPVLVECDTGALRCGVTTPAKAAALAQGIDRAPGLAFRGLMTYPPKSSVAKTQAWLAEAVELCERSGLPVQTVSNGGTPDLYRAHEVAAATEHRPGTYVYSDRYHVETHAFGAWTDCALTIQATVVSHPAPDRCVIDAGSKSSIVRFARTAGLRPHFRTSGLGDPCAERGARARPRSDRRRAACDRREGLRHSQPRLRGHQLARSDLRRPGGEGRDLLRRVGAGKGAMNTIGAIRALLAAHPLQFEWSRSGQAAFRAAGRR